MNAHCWSARLIVATMATAAGLLIAPAAPGAAADALAMTTHSSYTIDPDQGAVHVTMVVTVTNEPADGDPGGAAPARDRDTVPVPISAAAAGVRASSAGSALPVSLEPTVDPTVDHAVMALPTVLHDGESVTVDLAYDLIGAAPRSPESTRVAADAATFEVSAPGGEGHASVEVVVPPGWADVTTAAGFTEETIEGRRLLRATANTGPEGIDAIVSLHNPVVPTVAVNAAGVTFALRPWTTDTAWVPAVTDALTRGLPELQDTMGSMWPADGITTIREVSAPGPPGFDSVYDPASRTLMIGESLDPAVILHELAHVWLTEDVDQSRWLREGIAEYAARQAIDRLGIADAPQPWVARDAPDAVPLNAWDDAPMGHPRPADGYAARASRQVVEQLFTGLSPDAVAGILRAVTAGESAYDPPSALGDASRGVTDWRRFLDLVETRGGQVQAPHVFAEWVLTTDEQTVLTGRAAARGRYAVLDAANGTWLPPRVVRAAMTSWRFSEAEADMTAAGPASEAAIDVQQAADGAGVVVPAGVQASYENAASVPDLIAAEGELDRSATALHDLGSAIAVWRSGNPATHVGAKLLFIRSGISEAASDLNRGHLSAGQQEAAAVAARARWAMPVGVLALLLLGLAVAGGIRLGVRVAHRRRSRPAPAVDVPPVQATTPVVP